LAAEFAFCVSFPWLAAGKWPKIFFTAIFHWVLFFLTHTHRERAPWLCGAFISFAIYLGARGAIFHPKKAARAVPLNQYFPSFSPKT
jgi:hypothetical protein